ncbi:MAG: GNAT family N-acetyltransferase [Thermoplasmata archaeon]
MELRDRHRPQSYRGTTIRRVNWSKELDTVRRLFQEYRQWLADHQDPGDPSGKIGIGQIDEQIARLPGPYGPPRGEVLLALAKGAVAACGALRELEPKVGEIKRIYVRADHRGPGFGPRLTRALLRRARELGYERVRVDTLPTMFAAIQFYQALGFVPIPAYWPHPVPGALFFEYTVGKLAAAPTRHQSSTSPRSEP